MKQEGISRRQFIIRAAGVTLAVAGGSGYWAVRGPAIHYYESAAAIGSSYSQVRKILVGYASKYGSTGEIAKEIGDVLTDLGLAVDVKLLKNATDLSSYDSVIIGAPVLAGNWLPEAMKYVESNREQLSKKKVAYFLTCMTVGSSPEEEELEKITNIFTELEREVNEIKPIQQGYFAGVIDFGKMSPAMRGMLKLMPQVTEGDLRDWDSIRAWTGDLGAKLIMG